MTPKWTLAMTGDKAKKLTKEINMLREVVHAANSYIGLARKDLLDGAPTAAATHLSFYCEEADRIEVRYLGWERAQKLFDSGIISPSAAWLDEIERLKAEAMRKVEF